MHISSNVESNIVSQWNHIGTPVTKESLLNSKALSINLFLRTREILRVVQYSRGHAHCWFCGLYLRQMNIGAYQIPSNSTVGSTACSTYPQITHQSFALMAFCVGSVLQWRHNGRDGVTNHQPTAVYLTVYSDADQRKHQSSASLASVWEIHRWPVDSPHKGPVTRKIFPFDDVIMFVHHTGRVRRKSFPCRDVIMGHSAMNRRFNS